MYGFFALHADFPVLTATSFGASFTTSTTCSGSEVVRVISIDAMAGITLSTQVFHSGSKSTSHNCTSETLLAPNSLNLLSQSIPAWQYSS